MPPQTPESRHATRFAKNVSWSTRQAIKTLCKNYGPDIKFATARIEDGKLEIAFFAGMLSQEWAEEAHELARQSQLVIFIPDRREDDGEPAPSIR